MESSEITTDAPLGQVLDVLRASSEISSLYRDENQRKEIYRGGSPKGGYITVADDLKVDVDETETWIDVYEQTDEGLQYRLFEILAGALDVRVTRCPREGEPQDLGETVNAPAAAAK